MPSRSALCLFLGSGLDLHAEPLPVRRELLVQCIDADGQYVGGVGEPAVPVTAVAGEVLAHRRLGRVRDRHVVPTVETPDRLDRRGHELAVGDVEDAWVV